MRPISFFHFFAWIYYHAGGLHFFVYKFSKFNQMWSWKHWKGQWVRLSCSFWNLFKLFYGLIWRNSLTGIFYLLGLYYFSYTGHHPPPLSHLFSFLLQMIEVLITDCSSLYLEKWNIKQIGCCQPAALNFLLCQHQSIFRLRGWHSFEILFVSDLIFQSSSRRVVVEGRLPF